MAIYGLWHGGASYAPPDEGDLEEFPTLQAARQALQDRRDHGAATRQHFAYTHRPADDVFTPVAGDDSELLLFATTDTSYPSWRAFFGPRGGARIEAC